MSTLPAYTRLLTQRIGVDIRDELVYPASLACEHGPIQTDEAVAGLYNSTTQQISIAADLGFERQRATFLHEVLHACLTITDLASLLANDLDEHVVSALAPVLLAWMRDNPDWVSYLQEMQE